MQPQKKAIIEKALDVFRKRTQMDAVFLYEKTGPGLHGDGVVRLAHEDNEWEFRTEVKLRVNRASIALIKHQMNFSGNSLLVTDYVNPALAEFMRNQGIPFIDGAGNAFINATPLFIFIKGEKPDKAEKTEPVKRLFKPGGLKLIFALLNNPGMEKSTYRDMAKAARVALWLNFTTPLSKSFWYSSWLSTCLKKFWFSPIISNRIVFSSSDMSGLLSTAIRSCKNIDSTAFSYSSRKLKLSRLKNGVRSSQAVTASSRDFPCSIFFKRFFCSSLKKSV